MKSTAVFAAALVGSAFANQPGPAPQYQPGTQCPPVGNQDAKDRTGCNVNDHQPEPMVCKQDTDGCWVQVPYTPGYTPAPHTANGTPVYTSSTSSSAPAPAATTPAGGDLEKCAQDCNDAYSKCQTSTGPDGLSSNKSKCASDLAQCVGFNPFDVGGTYQKPQSCIKGSTVPNTPTAAPTTSTGPAPSIVPGGDAGKCAADCNSAFSKCQTSTGPDGLSSNKSKCASDLAKCLGYNPFNDSGTYVTPTACAGASSTAAPGPAPTYAPGPGGAVPAPAPGPGGVPAPAPVPAPTYGPSPPRNSTVPNPPPINGAAQLAVSGSVVAAVFGVLLL